MTIYALSSGPGISGVAVIRISGQNCSKVIKSMTVGSFPKPRVATLKNINKINTNELIDEGIIIWFPGPNSYTGEDMAEFHVHGSRAVINEIHNSISKVENCRLANPGEFTKIAFQNNKINLLKAESIADLISSETEIQRKQAIKIMSGKSSEKFNSWREKLIKILSNVEAKIDFPDENLPDDILKDIKSSSKKIKEEIKKLLDDEKIGERIREGFKISIVGPTNAGKSSLLNYLSKRDVAIVSEIAGTTRDVVETHLNIDGYPVIVSDTAGIRESKDEIEKRGIKLALKTATYTAAILIPLQIFAGDMHGLNTLKHQPQKVAAMEGLWETTKGAPLLLFAIPDEESRENHFEIPVPYGASFILTHKLDGEIKGLNEFEGEHPPVAPVFYGFRVMVGVGMLMLAVSWIGSFYLSLHNRRGSL